MFAFWHDGLHCLEQAIAKVNCEMEQCRFQAGKRVGWFSTSSSSSGRQEPRHLCSRGRFFHVFLCLFRKRVVFFRCFSQNTILCCLRPFLCPPKSSKNLVLKRLHVTSIAIWAVRFSAIWWHAKPAFWEHTVSRAEVDNPVGGWLSSNTGLPAFYSRNGLGWGWQPSFHVYGGL